MTQAELVKLARSSCFKMNPYSVHTRFNRRDFPSGLFLFTHPYTETTDYIENYLAEITPAFQRSNDQWSESQQTLFVENILKGYKSTIILFTVEKAVSSQVIDGLQRLTALMAFISGKIKVFGLYAREYEPLMLRKFGAHIRLNIIDFKTWQEVGDFYVEINEGITHSPADIQKAKDWFLNEKGLVVGCNHLANSGA